MRPGSWWVAFLLFGCSPAATPAPSEPTVTVPSGTDEPVAPTPPVARRTDTDEEMLATLRIDEKPGGKKFQGVWLERDDGEKWVIAYRPEGVWRPFEGKRVRVRGETYVPRGQAINATHFRVEWLAVARDDDKTQELVVVNVERAYSGSFEEFAWPAGSKLSGEKTTVFSSEGKQYFLANRPETITLGKAVEVRAREVVPSPYVARPGGPFLWILDP
jgi:hypothetical protein